MWDKLDVLRNIDSIIDFSRATAQLRILIALDNEPLTIDEIVEKTGLRRKTVLDALRKLEIKGIVERRNGKFILTSRGKSIYSSLKSIVFGSPNVGSNMDYLDSKPIIYDLYTDLLSVVYMLMVLKLLGGKKEHRCSLSKLASKLGVTEVTLENHLRRFMNPKFNLFRRVETNSKDVVYELTDVGLKLYHKLYPKRGIVKRLRYLITLLLRF